MLSRAGADVDQIIRRAQGLLVVFHHDQRIAQIAQAPHGFKKPAVVPLMKTDRRLIQDVQHPHQTAADLGREPDPLRFPAGQCRGPAGKRQVFQSHIAQKAQFRVHLTQDLIGDHALTRAKLKRGHKAAAVADVHIAHL